MRDNVVEVSKTVIDIFFFQYHHWNNIADLDLSSMPDYLNFLASFERFHRQLRNWL
jgi:hypothetical protein